MFRLYIAILLAAELLILAAVSVATGDARALLAALVLAPATIVVGYALRYGMRDPGRNTRGLSPESITGYRPSAEGLDQRETTPLQLSRSIVERSEEIRRTLSESPSEVQVEMCAIGYRSCVNDMISLTHKISSSTAEAGFLEKMRLRSARRKATDSLAKARQALPPGALRATRQELQ